jgi:hypothetical protein
MNLQEIVKKLSLFEYSLVHGGPRHPEYPNPSFADQIAQVFEAYPKLRKYHDFVDFLEMYVGAIIIYPDNSVDAAINGVWDYTEHLLEDTALEENKYMRFASIMLHPSAEGQIRGIHFAFDISDAGQGIYRSANYNDAKAQFGMRRTPYEWYCDTFIEWLEKFVAADGRLID